MTVSENEGIIDIRSIGEMRQFQKSLNHEIGELKARGESPAELVEESKALSARIRALEGRSPTAGPEDERQNTDHTMTVLTSSSEIALLCDEWRQLLLEAPTVRSPFMTWEWMMSWYETFERDGAIRCVVVRSTHGRLIGIVPLFLSTRPDRKLSKRQIGFASTYGHCWGFDFEILCAPDDCHVVTQALVQHLDSTRDEWDYVKLLRMSPESSSVWSILEDLIDNGCSAVAGAGVPAPMIALPEAPEEVVASLASSKLRSTIRQGQRRLARDHPQHSFVCSAEPAEILGAFDDYIRMNVQGHDDSTFREESARLCQERSLRRFAEAGRLRMVALRIGRDLVGAAPFIVCGGRLSLLSPGWDLEYAQYSPCHLLFVEAMRQGGANAALEADFLTADAPYKMQYTRQCRPRVDVVVAATRRKLTQLILAELGTSALQRLKRAFGPSRSR